MRDIKKKSSLHIEDFADYCYLYRWYCETFYVIPTYRCFPYIAIIFIRLYCRISVVWYDACGWKTENRHVCSAVMLKVGIEYRNSSALQFKFCSIHSKLQRYHGQLNVFGGYLHWLEFSNYGISRVESLYFYLHAMILYICIYLSLRWNKILLIFKFKLLEYVHLFYIDIFNIDSQLRR